MKSLSVTEKINQLRAESAAYRVGMEMLKSNLSNFNNSLKNLQDELQRCENKFNTLCNGGSDKDAIVYNMVPLKSRSAS